MSLRLKARSFCLALTLLAPASAQIGVWGSPVPISTGGQGFEAAAAIDGNGNSVALWDERTGQDHLWARPKPNGGAWGPVAKVSRALQTTLVLPAIRITQAGFATAVWTDSDGVWTADRPAGSKWNAPQLLVPLASGPLFVMNSQGDAAVAWTDGGPTDPHSTVMAVVRPAGGVWTSQQTVARGVHIAADHVGIGGNGAVIVTWESYEAVCGQEGCVLSNFLLHAAREAAGTATWVDSGVLWGPDDDSHDARVVLNSVGQAMLVGFSSSDGYRSSTQSASGGAWSPLNKVVQLQGISIVSDLASDNAGNVTLVYEFIGFSTSQAFAVNASISNNAWSSPVVLSGGDANIAEIYFAVAPSGAAVAVWVTVSATPEIRAIVRANSTGSWSSPVTVSQQGDTEIGPEAAAVNFKGEAIVMYSGYDAAQTHIEYAVNYQP